MIQESSNNNKDELRREIVKFIDYYGTHIITDVNFGARYIYNFTVVAKNEAELSTEFDSFQKSVNFELGILGFGLSKSKAESESKERDRKSSLFESIVETTVKSVGAALPEVGENGSTPDSEEWAKRAIENPVPTKVDLTGNAGSNYLFKSTNRGHQSSNDQKPPLA